MSRLTKVVSGTIFEDSFDGSTLGSAYTLSSSDPLKFSLSDRPGFLRLNHTQGSILVLLNIPEGDFVMEMGNEYIPVISSDIGGLIVWKTNEDYVELLEWFDETQEASITYPYMRVIKKDTLYTGYGSQDGSVWDMIGTVSFQGAGKIGVVLHGDLEEGSVPLDVDYIKIFRDTSISIANLPEGYKAYVYDELDNLISWGLVESGKNGVRVDLMNILTPKTGKIFIEDLQGDTVYWAGTTEIVHGDIYYYGDTLELYRVTDTAEELIEMTGSVDLGNLVSGNIECKFKVKNNTELNFNNVTIIPLPLWDYFGYQWIDMCTVLEDGSKSAYTPSIAFANIGVGEQFYFYIRVTRDISHIVSTIEPYRFCILLSHD